MGYLKGTNQEFLACLEQLYIKMCDYGCRMFGLPEPPPMEIVTSEEVKEILCPKVDYLILCGRKFPVRVWWADGPGAHGHSKVYIIERSQNCETDER
jgi:hypothetical protein